MGRYSQDEREGAGDRAGAPGDGSHTDAGAQTALEAMRKNRQMNANDETAQKRLRMTREALSPATSHPHPLEDIAGTPGA